jgi:hypothetical protein
LVLVLRRSWADALMQEGRTRTSSRLDPNRGARRRASPRETPRPRPLGAKALLIHRREAWKQSAHHDIVRKCITSRRPLWSWSPRIVEFKLVPHVLGEYWSRGASIVAAFLYNHRRCIRTPPRDPALGSRRKAAASDLGDRNASGLMAFARCPKTVAKQEGIITGAYGSGGSHGLQKRIQASTAQSSVQKLRYHRPLSP